MVETAHGIIDNRGGGGIGNASTTYMDSVRHGHVTLYQSL